ncbi:RDD family protein [Streptomyces sp. NA04227]|uniref:RDD family protein n=1 Tax=Streptomyces sp. NA04227 TaxID=2742136 RepID=UPI0015922BF6|nr:RDD family protein [Streptomyces sp. NA04227]QKW06837.1 RDD family protein [Streptomyces sp. NA04227]
MTEFVTGEAVALELRPARLPSRALAVLLDLVVVLTAFALVLAGLAAATASLDEAAQAAIAVAAFLLLLVGVPIAVETLSHGRSLGKLAFGLRVVRDDGGPIRFRHALVRGAMGMVEILMTMGVVACIASFVSARGRRLGDVFAGTLVVRERIPAARAGFVPPPPPQVAGMFAGLDLSGVPDSVWLGVRQYLGRMNQLDRQISWSMATRLAGELAARTSASVPHGMPPAMFLASVLQERQARDAQRAFGGFAGPQGFAPGPQPYGSGPQPYGPGPQPYGPTPTYGSAPAYGPPTITQPPAGPPSTGPSPSPSPFPAASSPSPAASAPPATSPASAPSPSPDGEQPPPPSTGFAPPS